MRERAANASNCGEPCSVVAVAADERDVARLLDRHDAEAVVFQLEEPARPVKGPRYFRQELQVLMGESAHPLTDAMAIPSACAGGDARPIAIGEAFGRCS